jgi:hypothetical protein
MSTTIIFDYTIAGDDYELHQHTNHHGVLMTHVRCLRTGWSAESNEFTDPPTLEQVQKVLAEIRERAASAEQPKP